MAASFLSSSLAFVFLRSMVKERNVGDRLCQAKANINRQSIRCERIQGWPKCEEMARRNGDQQPKAEKGVRKDKQKSEGEDTYSQILSLTPCRWQPLKENNLLSSLSPFLFFAPSLPFFPPYTLFFPPINKSSDFPSDLQSSFDCSSPYTHPPYTFLHRISFTLHCSLFHSLSSKKPQPIEPNFDTATKNKRPPFDRESTNMTFIPPTLHTRIVLSLDVSAASAPFFVSD